MKKNSFEIELPFFCGFYESALYNSNTLYYESMEIDYYRDLFGDSLLEPDDLDIDLPKYKDECSRAFVKSFFDSCECPVFIKSISFKELVSPRFYNFETDRIFAEVEFKDGWQNDVMEFMERKKEWLETRIRREWTSRDGFNSFMSNDINLWKKELSSENPDERYISSMIEYMMLDVNEDAAYNIISDTMEGIFMPEYIIKAN